MHWHSEHIDGLTFALPLFCKEVISKTKTVEYRHVCTGTIGVGTGGPGVPVPTHFFRWGANNMFWPPHFLPEAL